jgi:hypothetical protein
VRYPVQPQTEIITHLDSDNDTGMLVFVLDLSGIHSHIVPSLSSEVPADGQQIALNVQVLKNRLRGRGGRRGGRRGGSTTSGRESADSEYVANHYF